MISRREFAAGALSLATVAQLGLRPALAEASQQQLLVDEGRILVEQFLNDANFQGMRLYVQNAYGVLIFPGLLKAGFFVGAEYGRGMLLVRHIGSGQWSDPAFFDLFGGSLGLQFGGKASDVMFTLMNDRAVTKILSSKFTLGTDASVAAGPVGAGVGAGTTANFGEDVYVFARGKGLYGGLSVDGTYFQPKPEWNKLFYGQNVTPAAIVRDRVVSNDGTIPLREALLRF